MSLFVEFEYIDRNDNGRYTGVGAAAETDEQTRELFESARHFEVPVKTCDFLLDLRNEDREILDTIGISKEGFEQLTGRKPLTDEEYINNDIAFWQQIRKSATT